MITTYRTPAIVAGVAIGLLALLAPVGLMVALPAGLTGVFGLIILSMAALDTVAGVALYPVLRSGGELLAQCAAATRVVYGAAFAVAAGFLFAPVDVDRFHSVWEAALLIFGIHLILVGVAVIRARALPTFVGALVLISGAGYAVDAVSMAISPSAPLTVGEVTFVGEVVLAIWLLGWAGRSRVGNKHPRVEA